MSCEGACSPDFRSYLTMVLQLGICSRIVRYQEDGLDLTLISDARAASLVR